MGEEYIYVVFCQPGPRQSGSDLHCISATLMIIACQSFALFCALVSHLYLQSRSLEHTCNKHHSLAPSEAPLLNASTKFKLLTVSLLIPRFPDQQVSRGTI